MLLLRLQFLIYHILGIFAWEGCQILSSKETEHEEMEEEQHEIEDESQDEEEDSEDEEGSEGETVENEK